MLEGVTGIASSAGVVQDFDPHVTRIEDFITYFGRSDGDAINGWTVSRGAVEEEEQEPGFRYRILHSYVIKGHFGLKNPGETTEQAFQDLVDAVQTAIRGDRTIWVQHPELSDRAVSSTLITTETKGSFLIHTATMRLDVEEFAVT